MLSTTLHVTETIIAFALVVLVVVLLKRKNIVSVNELKAYSRLMTTAILPAVIFLQLSMNPVHGHQALLVLIMFLSGVISMILAWTAGKLLRQPRPTIGMLMITSSFGSSALIGYPLISFTFPDNPVAMTDAILISELGVGVPIFTLCPLVASYFGSATGGLGSVKDTVVQYIKSPIFIAVVAGIIFSQFPTIVHSQWLDPFWESMRMIQGTLTVIACLILGLQLRFSSVGTILPLFLVSAVIQIIIQPMIAGFGASLFDIALLDRQVLVLISAMPSAVLGTVFATQYNCDGQKASELVFLNILASLIGIPLVFYSLFH